MSHKLPDTALPTGVLPESPGVRYVLAVADAQPQPLSLDAGLLELLGVPAQRWLNDPDAWRQAIHPDDRSRFDAAVAGLAEQGYWSLEYRVQNGDGAYSDVRDVASLHHTADGPRVYGLLQSVGVDHSRSHQQQSDLLATLHRADSIIFEAADLDAALPALLQLALQQFGADRAWLLHPCDPQASHWEVPLERTTRDWQGAFAAGHSLPMSSDLADSFRAILASSQPVLYGPGTGNAVPATLAEQFSVRARMVMAVRPRIGDPWLFGIHYCADSHAFNAAEVKRFQTLGNRLGEALGASVLLKQLDADQRHYRHLFEQAPVSLWEEDASTVKQYLDDLRASGVDDLAAHFEQHPDEVALCAGLIQVLEVNQASLKLYGAKDKQDLLGNLSKTFNEHSLQVFRQELLAFSSGQFQFAAETETSTLQGEPLATRVRIVIDHEYQHDWSRMLVAITDITAHKQAEAEILSLNRTLKLIGECSQALMRAETVEQLLHAVCNEIVAQAGYRFAWVGITDAAAPDKQLRRIAQAGTDGCHLNQRQLSWADRPEGQHASGCAMRSQSAVVSQNLPADSHCISCIEQSQDGGCISTVALPIIERGQRFGALTICSAQHDGFPDAEIKLLQEFTGDIAYGIRVLRDREQQNNTRNHLQALHDASPDMIVILGAGGRVMEANSNALRTFGFDSLEALTASPHYQLFGNDTQSAPHKALLATAQSGAPTDFEWRATRHNGGEFDVEVRLRRLNTQGHVLALIRDIGERKSLQARLAQQAYYDELTGLPNRRLALERMSLALAIAQREQCSAALMLLDLDNFKQVNDIYGHGTGDHLLIRVAESLNTAIRNSDTVARLGGDEFLILMTDIQQQGDILSLANKVLRLLDRATIVDGHNLAVTTSIGIARYPSDGDDPDALLKAADSAMYKAKQDGRNTYRFFTAELDQRMKRYMAVGAALQQAVDKQQLQVFYQPVVNCQGKAIGAEALLRWRHPRWGWVSPTEFIPVAEDRGLIVKIGAKVLRQACRQLHQWRASGLDLQWVSVNLSPRQFWKQDLVSTVSTILQASGLSGARLKLEITEGLLLEHPKQAIDTLKGLQALDIHLALDDFGTGYSSLSYLKKYPFDSLKIDRSFIHNLHQDSDDLSLTRTIIAMARGLGLQVIAEGVEAEAGATLLATEGCDLLQGYLYSPALPAEEFVQWAQTDGGLPG